MQFRKAKISDVEKISQLISEYASKEQMLQRPKAMLYEGIREFIIAQDEDGNVIGAGALNVIWEDLAEIRSLAIRDDYRGKGIGTKIIEILIEDAKYLGIKRVFALTYQVEFFKKNNFQLIQKEDLPQKVWKDCINCHKFPNCDENAMIYYVDIQ